MPLNIKRIREEFQLTESDVSIIMILMNAGAMTGLAFTLLADVFGRANMYLISNLAYIIIVVITCLN